LYENYETLSISQKYAIYFYLKLYKVDYHLSVPKETKQFRIHFFA